MIGSVNTVVVSCAARPDTELNIGEKRVATKSVLAAAAEEIVADEEHFLLHRVAKRAEQARAPHEHLESAVHRRVP